ncbi:hypothetical protein [Streptomyces sp. NPDC002133]|uniref:hypothetical protein n=1 Tax=Streptomyces sp. NPDC002133 TaxID=3154409 RepID=UPI00332CB9FF
MAAYDFPDDLRNAQLRLHQARAQYRRLCQALPWSVVPSDGWTAVERQYPGYHHDFPATAGYTEERKAEEASLWALVRQLSIEVSAHPYWATLDRSAVVDARMALKRHPDAASADIDTDADAAA